MPNLTNLCDALSAAAAVIKKSGAKSTDEFRAAWEAEFGAGLDAKSLRDLHGVASEFVARQGSKVEGAVATRAKRMAAVEQTSLIEAIGSARKLGLVTQVRTSLRNALGNGAEALRREGLRPVDAAVDMLFSLRTGQRTTEMGWFGTGDFRDRSARAARATAKDFRAIVEHGVSADELARIDAYQSSNTGIKPLDWYIDTLGKGQAVQDRPWYQAAYARSIEEQSNLAAKLEAKKAGGGSGFDTKARTRALRDAPTEAMKVQAAIDAELATFNNPNAFASMLNGARKYGDTYQAVVDLVVPFKRVPSNIASTILRANPFGLMWDALAYGKVIVDESLPMAERLAAQKRLAGLTTNAALGTSLIAYGYWLGDAGLMEGASSSDKADRDTGEALGIRPASIRVGDTRVSIVGMHPLINLIGLGATLRASDQARVEKQARESHELDRKGHPVPPRESTTERVARYAAAYSQIMVEQPMLSGPKQITDAARSDSTIGNYAAQLAASFVPTAVTDVGTLLGDVDAQRSPEGLLQGVQAKVPWARAGLPPKINALGEPVAAPQRLGVLDVFSIKPDPHNATDPVKRWMVKNEVKITKPARESGETAAMYADRLTYVGKAVKERLAIEAENHPELDEIGRDRIDLVVSAIRRQATARYFVERAQRAVRPQLALPASGADEE